MNLIFEHEDEEADRIKIRECLDYLIIRSEGTSDDAEVEVRLRHDRVAALHATLGKWLGRTAAPIASNSLIDQLIVKRVAEEVARVLPLHQAPLAEGEWEPAPHDAGHPEEPKYIDASTVRNAITANRLLSDLTRMADVAKRAAGTIQESSRVWGTDGTSPNGYVPPCQVRGCGHEYADHIKYTHGGSEECAGSLSCTCTRYRSTP